MWVLVVPVIFFTAIDVRRFLDLSCWCLMFPNVAWFSLVLHIVKTTDKKIKRFYCAQGVHTYFESALGFDSWVLNLCFTKTKDERNKNKIPGRIQEMCPLSYLVAHQCLGRCVLAHVVVRCTNMRCIRSVRALLVCIQLRWVKKQCLCSAHTYLAMGHS